MVSAGASTAGNLVRLRVLAVGNKMPAWVDQGVTEYARRMPREVSVEWLEAPLAKRGNGSADSYRRREAEFIQSKLSEGEDLIALDVQGVAVSTEQIADRFADWQMRGRRICLVIGGPDGLHQSLLKRASELWSFGRITLPHSLVRIILAEQLYRAWSLQSGHPYHRAN